MSKLKTILVVFVALVLNAFSQQTLMRPGSLRRPEAASTAAQEEESNYWSSWPATLSNEECKTLLYETEKKFNAVILGFGEFGGTTNTWNKGDGKSLIVIETHLFHKYNQDGLLVSCGRKYKVMELDEIKWYNAEMTKRLEPLRTEWAKERGMTLDEAIRKHNEWIASRPMRPGLPSPRFRRPGLIRPGLSRPGLNHEPGLETARARREERLKQQQTEAEQQRQAAEQDKKEREQEKKERELAAEERKVQLEQLMQLKEELRRQREERARKERELENGRP